MKQTSAYRKEKGFVPCRLLASKLVRVDTATQAWPEELVISQVAAARSTARTMPGRCVVGLSWYKRHGAARVAEMVGVP